MERFSDIHGILEYPFDNLLLWLAVSEKALGVVGFTENVPSLTGLLSGWQQATYVWMTTTNSFAEVINVAKNVCTFTLSPLNILTLSEVERSILLSLHETQCTTLILMLAALLILLGMGLTGISMGKGDCLFLGKIKNKKIMKLNWH